jgi:hypothetical protein
MLKLRKDTINNGKETLKSKQTEELKKPIERYLTQEAKDKGLNELEYFINYWGNKHDLKMALRNV